jgi:hypothetical protein
MQNRINGRNNGCIRDKKIKMNSFFLGKGRMKTKSVSSGTNGKMYG